MIRIKRYLLRKANPAPTVSTVEGESSPYCEYCKYCGQLLSVCNGTCPGTQMSEQSDPPAETELDENLGSIDGLMITQGSVMQKG